MNIAVHADDLLAVATGVLVASPMASLADVAAAAGVGRTTLHLRYPTRNDLLVALAHQAMDLVERAYAAARLTDDPVRVALGRLVELLVPLGARMEFLLRERSLDADEEVSRRYLELDQPLVALVERGRASGELRSDLPVWWLVTSLFAAVYAAWGAIADGRLAPRDAAALVLDSTLDGMVPR